jgi:methyl-accepting chemotaxis protein
MRWTVGTKLGAGLAVIGVLLAVIAVDDRGRDEVIEQRMLAIYQRGVVSTQLLSDAAAQLQRMKAHTYRHIAEHDVAAMRQIQENIAKIQTKVDSELTAAEATYDETDATRGLIKDVRNRLVEYAKVRDERVLAASTPEENEVALSQMVRVGGPIFEELSSRLDTIIESNIQRSSRTFEEAQSALMRARQLSIGGTGLALLLLFAVAWLFSHGISQRMKRLAKVATAIGAGDREQRADVTGTDEIADLAVSFNAMTAELARRGDEQRKSTEEQADIVTRYGALVDTMARGDLRERIEPLGTGALAMLGQNLDAMRVGLRDITVRTGETAGGLASATAAILLATQQQSASAHESAAAVRQTVTAIDEVTQTANQAAERARAVSAASQRSIDVSAAGHAAVERTEAAMARVRAQVESIAERILSLSEQAQTVGQIITTVNELAERSNLLALNASIEAARAGEHGRGFGVVAQEMRGLAEQSKRATGQIRGILSEIQKSTRSAVLVTDEGSKAAISAVDTMRAAGEGIRQLSATIADAAHAAEQIVTTVEQQVTGMSQVSRAMHAIDQAISQSVEGTQGSERSAHELSELGARLRNAIAQYST